MSETKSHHTHRAAIYRTRIQLFLALIGVGVGCAFLVWGYFPHTPQEHILNLDAIPIQSWDDSPAIEQEARTMVLTYPTVLRAGERNQARLIFQPQSYTGAIEPPEPSSIPIFVETRLELPGVLVEPAGVSGQVLSTGRAVTFWWALTGTQSGEYEGTAWLSLRYEHPTDPGAQTYALAAPRLLVRVERFVGFSGLGARWMGGSLSLGGLFLLFWRFKHA
jgi:hypothetical protein